MSKLEVSTGVTYHIAMLHLHELTSKSHLLPKLDASAAARVKEQHSEAVLSRKYSDMIYTNHLEVADQAVQDHLQSNNWNTRILSTSKRLGSSINLEEVQFQGDVAVQSREAIKFSSKSMLRSSVSQLFLSVRLSHPGSHWAHSLKIASQATKI